MLLSCSSRLLRVTRFKLVNRNIITSDDVQGARQSESGSGCTSRSETCTLSDGDKLIHKLHVDACKEQWDLMAERKFWKKRRVGERTELWMHRQCQLHYGAKGWHLRWHATKLPRALLPLEAVIDKARAL